MLSSAKIAFFIGAVFLSLGIYLPFFPRWLEVNGFHEADIAILLSVPLIVKVIFTPFATALAGRFSKRRHAATLYCVISFLAFAALKSVGGFWPILFCLAVFGVFWHTLIPISDSFTLSEVRRNGANYGAIRLWGSVTYIIANLGAGLLLPHLGIDGIYWLIALMLFVAIGASMQLPHYGLPVRAKSGPIGSSLEGRKGSPGEAAPVETFGFGQTVVSANKLEQFHVNEIRSGVESDHIGLSPEGRKGGPRDAAPVETFGFGQTVVSVNKLEQFHVNGIRSSERGLPQMTVFQELGRFCRQRHLVAMALATGLFQASHAILYGFGTIDWLSRGYSTAEIGFFWAIGVVAEIFLFTQAKSLFQRVGPVWLVAIGGSAAVLRWLFHGEIDGFWLIFAWQMLHGLSFGATHLGTQAFISSTVDDAGTPAAQGVVVLISGFLMAALSLLSGVLYANWGSDAFIVMAGVSVIGFIPLWAGGLSPKLR